MTLRQFNWTGRRRLGKKDVDVSLVIGDGVAEFRASLHLDGLGLPDEAPVLVEAYRQTSLMRFPYGTVKRPGPEFPTALSEFDPPEGVLFRVKIIGIAEKHGMIIAEADGIRAVAPGDQDGARESLLPTRGEDLRDQAWQLDFSGDAPQLLVNRMPGDWRSVARSPHFLWLVYPEVLRQVLTKCIESGFPDPSDDDWRSRWIRFASSLPGMSLPAEGEVTDADDWVGEAVASFCRRHRFRDRFSSLVYEVGE